jgi:2,3-bisphosphoglycerate-independent phosphoglycerate mutase
MRSKKKLKTKKVLLFVIDGLADLPIDNKTPLSVANKPNMDWFAANGVCGTLYLVPKKLPIWSHIANISLLGYNPTKVYLKRGPLEAVGADLPYKEGYLALRCNFATVDKDLKVLDRRAGRETFGLDEIIRDINLHVNIGVPFLIKRTYGHRVVLIIKMDLDDRISDNDPLKEGEKVKNVQALAPQAIISAKIVQDFIEKLREVIEYSQANLKRIERGLLPANYLLVRDAGNRLPVLKNFVKSNKIKNAVCISEAGVMKATCMLAGFDAITIPELSFEDSLDFTFKTIENVLPEYEFIYVHIKGPDESAHDGKFEEKVKRIEAIDKKLAAFKNFDGVLIITCDHITSCELKSHVHGEVPFLIYGLGKGKIKRFNELDVKKSKLRKLSGKKFWKFVFSKIGKQVM